MNIVLIQPDRTEKEIVPGNGKTLSLEELQKHVGGYVERVKIKAGEMYVDEDGRAKGLAHNPRASDVAGMTIVGNALVKIRKGATI